MDLDALTERLGKVVVIAGLLFIAVLLAGFTALAAVAFFEAIRTGL